MSVGVKSVTLEEVEVEPYWKHPVIRTSFTESYHGLLSRCILSIRYESEQRRVMIYSNTPTSCSSGILSTSFIWTTTVSMDHRPLGILTLVPSPIVTLVRKRQNGNAEYSRITLKCEANEHSLFNSYQYSLCAFTSVRFDLESSNQSFDITSLGRLQVSLNRPSRMFGKGRPNVMPFNTLFGHLSKSLEHLGSGQITHQVIHCTRRFHYK